MEMRSRGTSVYTRRHVVLLVVWFFCTITAVQSFSVARPFTRGVAPTTRCRVTRRRMSDSWENDEDSEEQAKQEPQEVDLPNMELAWRYAKKPLLRIGSKGATLTHGNSLRQLLDAHTVVKVKINTRKFGAYVIRKRLCSKGMFI